MPLGQHTNTSNTLYMFNMDVGYNLMWMSALTMMKLHSFHSTNDQKFQKSVANLAGGTM
jgi:hypothetical protein